jgi:ferritin-like metal-binding protein YciE
MEGLVDEGSDIIQKAAVSEVLDAGLIAVAQRVEHYEMAAYGTLRSFAKILGHKNAVKLLEMTLEEEAETDQRLTNLAEGEINLKALSPGQDDEESKSYRTKNRQARA